MSWLIFCLLILDSKVKEFFNKLQSTTTASPKIAQIVFYGLPRSGKSTLIRNVLGLKQPDFSSSTDALKKMEFLIDPKTMMAAMDKDSNIILIGEEASGSESSARLLLVHFVQSAVLKASSSQANQSVHRTAGKLHSDQGTSGIIPSEQERYEVSSPLKTSSSNVDDIQTGLTSNDSEIPSPEDKIMEMDDILEILEQLSDCTFLSVFDTGGQPEFVELIPVLFNGSDINVFVFNLKESLHERYIAEYAFDTQTCSDGYVSCATTAELMQQFLESSMSRTQSKWFLVGTHRQTTSEKQIAQCKDELDHFLDDAKFHGLIKRTKSRSYNVENFPKDGKVDCEVNALRKRINSVLQELHAKQGVPKWYFLLLYVLRVYSQKGDEANTDAVTVIHPIITMGDCRRLAIQSKCIRDHSKDDLEELKRALVLLEKALVFLDHGLGAIKYFGSAGDPKLEDLIVSSPEGLYTIISRLIIKTFKYPMRFLDDQEQIISDLCKQGIINQEMLIDVFSECLRSEEIQTQALADLLETLGIIASIDGENVKDTNKSRKSSDSKGMNESRKAIESEIKYFLPCSLQTYPVEICVYKCKEHGKVPAPILMKFKQLTYFPIGSFPVLVATLASKA